MHSLGQSMLAIDKASAGFLYSQVIELIDQKISSGDLRPLQATSRASAAAIEG